MSRAWRPYVHYFAAYRGRLLLAAIGLCARAILLAGIVYVLRDMVDRFGPQAAAMPILRDAGGVLLLSIGSAGLTLQARNWITDAIKQAIAAIRRDLVGEVQHWPIDRIEREGRVAIQMRIVHDTEMLDHVTHAALSGIAPALLALAALALALLWISPGLGFAGIVILALCWLPGQAVRAGTRGWGLRFRDAFEDFSRATIGTLERAELARTSGAEAAEYAANADRIETVRAVSTKMVNRSAAVVEMHGLVSNFAMLLLLMLGGFATQRGLIGIPNLVATFAVLVLARAQIAAIVVSLPAIQDGRASIDRIRLPEALPAETPAPGHKIDFRGRLELRGVDFAFGERAILTGVDLTIASGECILISGANGAGKSTLVRLLLGLYAPDAGTVLAENTDLRACDVNAVRHRIGAVPQQSLLFEGSIAANVAYAHPQATPEAIQQSIHIVGADELVARLPHGVDTLISDRGGLFSGGERQRIALARALVGDPRLLILDEPFNHLSADAPPAIIARLRALPQRPAILLISHDVATATLADVHYRLEGGRLIRQVIDRPEIGTAA